MKIVHIEDFFHPDAGYQVNVLARLQSEQGHNVTIVTSELDRIPSFLVSFFGKDNIDEKDNDFFNRTGVKVVRVPIYKYYSGRSIYKLDIFKRVDSLNPDIVFVHGEDTLIGMQFILRYYRKKYPLFMDCHMLEMASENRFRSIFRFFYRRFITPLIIKYSIPLARVVDSDYVEKHYGIPLDKTHYLPLGTDVNYFKADSKNRESIREKLDIGNEDFVVLYAGKLDKFKGGSFFSEAIIPKVSLKSGRDVVFLVIGNVDDEIGDIVENNFSLSENRIIRLPTQPYLNLRDYYQIADVAVYPRQCSMSFFEAQSCGLPVIFEENEINLQRSASGSCFTFSPGNSKEFIEQVVLLGSKDNDEMDYLSERARAYVVDNFNFVPVAKEFSRLMEEECHRFKITLMPRV